MIELCGFVVAVVQDTFLQIIMLRIQKRHVFFGSIRTIEPFSLYRRALEKVIFVEFHLGFEAGRAEKELFGQLFLQALDLNDEAELTVHRYCFVIRKIVDRAILNVDHELLLPIEPHQVSLKHVVHSNINFDDARVHCDPVFLNMVERDYELIDLGGQLGYNAIQIFKVLIAIDYSKNRNENTREVIKLAVVVEQGLKIIL